MSLSELSIDPDYRGHRNWAKRGVFQRSLGDYVMNKERIEFLKEDYVQGFPAAIGFEVDQAAYGIFETRLKIRSDHIQQDGFVHAGVIATMADHTAG